MARSRGGRRFRFRFRFHRRNLCAAAAYAAVLLIAVSSFFTLISLSRKDGFEDRRERVSSEEEHRSEPIPDRELWDAPFSFGLHTCVKPTAKYKDQYITVRSNGGLNQMRTGIADMVAVALIMKATLVIPQLDRRSFWKDTGIRRHSDILFTFSDIFDETHFIEALKGDIRVATELRKELESVPHARKHFSSWASMGYYEELTRLWNEYQICISHASFLSEKVMERLRSRDGRYVALHLRYEKYMLSFTGCTWNTNHWKVKKINSIEQRLEGNCPLTPKEVGIFLRALGYPSSTLIYIAAGEIYGGNSRLSTLSSRFPNLVFKETLATKDELEGFTNHASQSAAIDYIISVESDVFVSSYSGNMGRAVEGHRRYLGHRRTITPDRKGLVEVFDRLESGDLREGSSLSELVRQMHDNRQGAPRKRKGPLPGLKGKARSRTEESFYENPYPECICGPKSHSKTM
ncbi:hypothetical protein ACJRO7_033916 [Eucalyptus globulus]|uniref:O-fucosyltransferase family protein n=1 Tax=Eucalyptus globulus TaxID=34317 RepID=A0ABD3J6Y2_EUCGL